MTDINVEAAGLALDHATRAATMAARVAGVSVRELTDLAELNGVVELFATIWGRSGNPPVTIELLRAFTKAGNYVAGAFEADRLIGACVGFALKLHQRAWALTRGVSEIAWTFDPLVARNAYFNLVKLAARPAEYLTNFYGPMLDALNGDQDSDRLLVRWPLRDRAVALASTGGAAGAVAEEEIAAGAVLALGIAEDGGPVPGRLDGAVCLVAVPPDIAGIRATDPGMARRWRVAVRDALTGLISGGGRIDGFDRAGWYVVRREP